MRVSEIAHILKVRIVTNVLLGHMDQLDRLPKLSIIPTELTVL